MVEYTKVTDLEQLLELNLEIEGCIRVLIARESPEARLMLRGKIEALAEAYTEWEDGKDMEKEQMQHPEEEADVAKKPSVVDEAEIPTVENRIAQQASRDFSKAFTLNDRYRFTQSLFHNDTENFSIAVNRIEKMESLSDAYDYLLNELNWDADQPEASDFLAIVANHFNSAE